MSSKLHCTMIWGATVWAFVVIIFVYLRLDINFQFTEHLSADDRFVDVAKPVDRASRDVFAELPAHISRYAHQVFAGVQPEGPGSLDSKCTMVVLTYNREEILKFLLSHYCKVRSLHKIVVLWNNVNKSIPNDVLEIGEKACIPDLLFIREKENKLTNRFKPRPEIETNCVCIMDDDRFIVDLGDLEFGFNVWQNFRHRIVGFEHRTHFQLQNGSFWYDLTDFSKPRTNYSMILTSTAILHKAYLQMFFDSDVLPKGMIEYIDKRRNCEDIGINVMVAKFLMDLGQRQAAALAVKPRRKIRNMEAAANKSGYTGLSSLPDHYIERSRCLDDFRDMYGGELPLPHATFIVENMMTIPMYTRRNKTYLSSRYRYLTHNVSRPGYLTRNGSRHGYLTRNASGYGYLIRSASRYGYPTRKVLRHGYLTSNESRHRYLTRNASRYRYLTHNASHSYSLRPTNSRNSSKFYMLNVSDPHRTHNSFLAQGRQYNSLHPYLQKPNHDMIHSPRSNMTSYVLKMNRSRSLNVTQLQRQYHDSHQESIKEGHSRYFNATQLRRPYHGTYQEPLKGGQLTHFNATQLSHNRHSMEPVRGQGRITVNRNGTR